MLVGPAFFFFFFWGWGGGGNKFFGSFFSFHPKYGKIWEILDLKASSVIFFF